MFWGLSESLDLCQEYTNAFKVVKGSEKVEDIRQSIAVQEIIDEKPESIENKTEEENIEKLSEIIEKTAENVENIVLENVQISEQPMLSEAASGDNNDEKPRLTAGQDQDQELEREEKVEVLVFEETLEVNIEEQASVNCLEKGAGDYLRTDKAENTASTPPRPPPPPKVLHILLFGSADPRHVLHTMAKLHKQHCVDGAQPYLHFYVVEGCLEIIARYIVLLGIALENAQYYSLLGKTHLYMDVYGNSLLRPSSHQYLAGKAKTLLKILTDTNFMQQIVPMLNFENLKYSERDGLEMAFHFWYPKQEHNFDIKTYWENRNRKLLGTRYDYRNGAFDWDLSMTLKDRQGHQICSQEYRYWRETGIAFTYPEYEQCQPNKTLAAGLIRNGNKYRSRGYVGDIQTGPFCAFGLKTEEKSMCNSSHGENDYRATEITERNLLELMYELQMHQPYEHNAQMFRKLGPVRLQMCKRLTTPQIDSTAVEVFDQPWLDFNNVKVHFLSMDEIVNMQKSTNRYKNFFDIAFVGHNYFTFIKEEFINVLKPQALLLLETKLLTVLKRETLSEFETKLKNFAKNAHLQPVINYNALNAKHTILKYKNNKKN